MKKNKRLTFLFTVAMGTFGHISAVTLPITEATTTTPSAITRTTASLRKTDLSQWTARFALKEGSVLEHTLRNVKLGDMQAGSGMFLNAQNFNGVPLSAPIIVYHNATYDTVLCALITSDIMSAMPRDIDLYHRHGRWTQTYDIEGMTIIHTPSEIIISSEKGTITHPLFVYVNNVYLQTKSTQAEFENCLLKLSEAILKEREKEAEERVCEMASRFAALRTTGAADTTTTFGLEQLSGHYKS